MSADFRPTLYLKKGCPSCLKVRLFLLEAGLLDRFRQREFEPGDEREQAIRDELAPHFDKVTFPTLQEPEGQYLQESDLIIERLAAANAIEPAAFPVFQAYANGLLPRFRQLSKENKELKARLADC